MLETRTLLSINATLSGGVLTFNGATSNDHLILYETNVNNVAPAAPDGFAASDTQGIVPSTPTKWLFTDVSSIVVDLSGHVGTTLTVGSGSQAAPWNFTSEPIKYTGAGSTSTLETQGVATAWSLAQDSESTTLPIIGTVNSPTPSTAPISFSGVGTLNADLTTTNTLTGEIAPSTSTWTLGTSANDGTYFDGYNTVNFSGFDTLTAGSGATNDTLVGVNSVTSTWTLSGSANDGSYNDTTDSTAVSFNNFENLTAGSGATDTLEGETGATSTWALTDSVHDGTYSDATTTVNFTGFDTLTAGSGATDTLVGETGATSTWTLSGSANDGTYGVGANTVNFTNFNTLTAGLNATDTLVGENSVDTTWTLSDSANDGTYDDTTNRSTVNFSGFDTLTAGTGTGATNTLTGENVYSDWTLGATQTYSDGSAPVAFSGFDTLKGGSGGNWFDVSASFTGSLYGGTGDYTNTFNLWSGGVITGSLYGGNNNDTDINLYGGSVSNGSSPGIVGQGGHSTINYSVPVTATVSGFNTIGYSGNDLTIGGTPTSVSGGFTGINMVVAPAGSTLTGDSNTTLSTWTLASTGGTSTYTYLDNTSSNTVGSLTFAGFDTLQGGTGSNTFVVSTAFSGSLRGGGVNTSPGTAIFDLNAGGSVSNGISPGIVGQSGDSTINYSAAVNVNLSGHNTYGYNGSEATSVSGGFTGINTVNANAITGGTLTGDSNTSTWDLAALTFQDTSPSTLLTLTFSHFGTLVGGSGTDTFSIDASTAPRLNLEGGGSGSHDYFVFAAGHTLNGTINGEAGTSTLDYSSYTSPVTVNLGTAMATGTLGISNIKNLDGTTTTGTTTLVGPNAVTTWTISAANGGSLSSGFTFSSVQKLSGGVRANTFDLDSGASVSGTITGGSTSDTLNLEGSGAATVNIGVNSADTTTGNNLGYVSIGSTTVLNFSGIANVTGTTGTDNYVLSNGMGLTGTLTGGGGTDTINYSAYTTGVRVNLTTGVDSATCIDGGRAGGITGIANVVGGNGNDILIGDANTTNLTDGSGNDIIVGGGGAVTITGGTGDDIIITGSSTGAATVYGDGDGGKDLTIGGSYTQQTNLAALNSLMAEWSRTDEGVSPSTRISHLNGTVVGGRNGEYFLNASTVHTDSAIAALYGGDGNTIPSSGNNWFIASSTGKVKDKAGSDIITVL